MAPPTSHTASSTSQSQLTSTTTSGNQSVAIARQSVVRRTAGATNIDRITKKRRPALVGSLDLLALAVAGTRTNPKAICALCTSSFGRRCELKRHIAEVHTLNGARRFVCTYPSCEKSFTRKDALAKHIVVKHQGKRRFVCPTCSEKFTSRYDLSRHAVRVHSNVKKRFTCEFCKAGFSQKSQLTMHKGRVHSQGNKKSNQSTTSTSTATSMDSLAAVAVAIAAQEESASISPRRVSQEEAQAAARATDVLLEAAAVLEPQTPCESTATTIMTTITDIPTHSSTEHVETR